MKKGFQLLWSEVKRPRKISFSVTGSILWAWSPYHNQKTLHLVQRGTAADYPGHYHDDSSSYQDVRRSCIEAGAQQTDVVALFHQSPHTHRQHSPTCQLTDHTVTSSTQTRCS